MSSPPACGVSAAIELPSIRHCGDPSPSLPEGLLPCPTHTHTPQAELAGLTPCLGWQVCMPREAPGEGRVPGHPRRKFRPWDPLSGEGEVGRSSVQAAEVAKEAPCALLCGDLGADSWSEARPARLAGAFPRRYWALGASTGKTATSCSSGTHWPQGLGCGGRGKPGGSRHSGPRTGVSPPLRLREEESHCLGSGAQPVPWGNGSEKSQGW